MASIAFRGGVALFAAVVVTSPAWAGWAEITSWVSEVPQPGALALFLIAVGGLVAGRYASSKRREP